MLVLITEFGIQGSYPDRYNNIASLRSRSDIRAPTQFLEFLEVLNSTMNENTPLLSGNSFHERSHTYQDLVISVWRTWRIPILCYITALLLDFAEVMRHTPKTQLYESILCERYYMQRSGSAPGPDFEITERMCKVPEVQGALVSMQARLKMGENMIGRALIHH